MYASENKIEKQAALVLSPNPDFQAVSGTDKAGSDTLKSPSLVAKQLWQVQSVVVEQSSKSQASSTTGKEPRMRVV